MLTFGKRVPNLDYWFRSGAYAFIQNNEGKVLCVEDSDRNLYLIGGGIEANESPQAALTREAMEETGYTLTILEQIGTAEKHWVSAKYPTFSQHNQAVLYRCQLGKKIAEPTEKEKMIWVSLEQLKNSLFHEHHLYLIHSYLKKGTSCI